MASDSKHMVLTGSTPWAFFVLDGVECGKGSVVSVMFENDTWHTGFLDAYNHKTFKVRISFPDPRIGTVFSGFSTQ